MKKETSHQIQFEEPHPLDYLLETGYHWKDIEQFLERAVILKKVRSTANEQGARELSFFAPYIEGVGVKKWRDRISPGEIYAIADFLCKKRILRSISLYKVVDAIGNHYRYPRPKIGHQERGAPYNRAYESLQKASSNKLAIT